MTALISEIHYDSIFSTYLWRVCCFNLIYAKEHYVRLLDDLAVVLRFKQRCFTSLTRLLFSILHTFFFFLMTCINFLVFFIWITSLFVISNKTSLAVRKNSRTAHRRKFESATNESELNKRKYTVFRLAVSPNTWNCF